MDGILPLWKEPGMTSHDCVFKLRKILNTKKIGHTGTLDPAVSGVLPICVGKGTKLVDFLMNSGKMYTGEITLGIATTTEDAEGEIVAQASIQYLPTLEEIDQVLTSFQGEITQVPPMYSAVKVNGKKLYEYARLGEIVERPKRKISIEFFARTSEPILHENGTVTFDFSVACGKGTYVRTLAVDVGGKLGYPAHMSKLVRVKSGGFVPNDCFTLQAVSDLVAQEDWHFLKPIESVLQNLQRVDMSEELWQKVKNGVRLPKDDFLSYDLTQPVVFYYQDLACIMYEAHPTDPAILKPSKVFRNQ